jgi:hypothetical protein
VSKLIITEDRASGRLVIRIGWFVAIWAASIVVVAGVAEGLKRLILG